MAIAVVVLKFIGVDNINQGEFMGYKPPPKFTNL